MKNIQWQARAAFLVAAAIITSAFGVSCKHQKAPISTVLHHGVGVVESIDKDNSMVQINHEDIPDYMPAMNMPFHVKQKALLDTIQAGDKIEFTLKDSEKGMIVTEIKKRQG